MSKSPVKKSNVYLKIKRFKEFFERVKLRPIHLLIPTVLAFVASVFEGISIGLLIPTIKGILDGDFSFVGTKPILGKILHTFPYLFEGRNSAVFILLVAMIFLAATAKNIFKYLSSLATLFQVRRLTNHLRALIYERYLSFGKLFFDHHSLGHLHQILMGYSAQIGIQLGQVHSGLNNFFLLITYLCIMVLISWKLTCLILIAFPVLYYSFRSLMKRISETSNAYAESYSELGKKIYNALTCIPLVKAYTHEDEEQKWFRRASDSVERFEFSMDQKRTLVNPLQEILLLCVVLVLVSATAFLLFRERAGEISGYMVFFLVLNRSITSFGFFNSFAAHMNAVMGPISEILTIFDDKDKFFIPDGTLRFTGLKAKIEFCDLDFSYSRGTRVLKGVTLSIEKGKMTAIVGPSGSGKTTLIHLLLRFYDSPPGAIRIDNVDIREFTLESLRAKMAFVGQETLLFNASIRSNLAYGLDGAVTDEDIEGAVREARLHDFIARLPEGLETEIGDRGVKLSGGERQRVAVARAILKKADILLLDEATSALDSRTENLVQESLSNLTRDKTTIVIAHRLSTIRNAHGIVVLEDGRIAEQGSLGALLNQKGKFYQYWQEQKFY